MFIFLIIILAFILLTNIFFYFLVLLFCNIRIKQEAEKIKQEKNSFNYFAEDKNN